MDSRCWLNRAPADAPAADPRVCAFRFAKMRPNCTFRSDIVTISGEAPGPIGNRYYWYEPTGHLVASSGFADGAPSQVGAADVPFVPSPRRTMTAGHCLEPKPEFAETRLCAGLREMDKRAA